MLLVFVLNSLVFRWLCQHACFLALQELEAKSLRKSCFLWEEHDRMEREAAMLWLVDELKRQLESARHESEDWVAEALGA